MKYGTQWSELWCLPYWDPSRQLVVDLMHCIIEGLAHTHFHEVLGLIMTQASAPAPPIREFMHNFTPANLADTRISDNPLLKIVTLDVMQHIRDVIECTITLHGSILSPPILVMLLLVH